MTKLRKSRLFARTDCITRWRLSNFSHVINDQFIARLDSDLFFDEISRGEC